MLQSASEMSNQKQCYKTQQKRPIRNNVTKHIRNVQSETMSQSASGKSNQKQCYKARQKCPIRNNVTKLITYKLMILTIIESS